MSTASSHDQEFSALLELQAQLVQTTDPTRREAIARSLPRTLVGLSPEAQQKLASLYESVCAGTRGPVLPDWRAAGLLPAVAQTWLRLELTLASPRLHASDGRALPAALRGLPGAALRDPETLLALVCEHADPELQREGLRLVGECLVAGTIAPARAVTLLQRLLDSHAASVQTGALVRLAEPWAHGFACPRVPLQRALAADDVDLAIAATRLAGLHGLHGALRALAGDAEADSQVRREALLQGMSRCDRAGIADWIALAVEDPPLFGSACLTALRAQHRRGGFIGDGDVAGLLALAAGDHTLELAELAALGFTSRQALLRALRATPANDPRWRRWLPLLLALDSDEVPGLVCELLAATEDPPQRRRLIAALGPLRDTSAEDSVLAWLEREPTVCLTSLRSLGGQATVAVLRRDLGLEDAAGVRPYLQGDVPAAVGLLWHLQGEHEPGRALLRERLPASALPPEIVGDLRPTMPLADLPLLLADVAEPAAVNALKRLAREGSCATLPLVRDLLRRVVSEIVGGLLIARDGESQRPPPGAARASEAERQIGEDVLAAVRALGVGLYQRGALRPACLVGIAASQAGLQLLAELLIDLSQETDDPESLAIVLHALTPLPDRRIRRLVHRHLRHRDPRVRAAAVICLAAHGADDLCASLTRLVQTDDLATARQAVRALAGVGASAAAGAIAACLEHPNMNLKKTAAEALQTAGAAEAVPAIVRWLGSHDNPGLRDALLAALTAIVGEMTGACLLAGLDAVPAADPSAPRRWLLLVLALDRRLTAAAVLAAVRRVPPWLPSLLAALVDGRIAPRSGDHRDLLVLLHAHGLAKEPSVQAALPRYRPAVQALLEHGLRDAGAVALLADCAELKPHELAVVRPYLREWLAALTGPHAAAALALVLQIADAGANLDERKLLTRAIDALTARLDDGPREPLLALLDSLLPRLDPLAGLRLASRLRASSPRPNLSGRPWLTRLRRCGAVLTRADLDRALHDCAGTPDPARLARTVLCDALGPVADARTSSQQGQRTALLDSLRAGEGAQVLARDDVSARMYADLYPDCPEPLRAAWIDRLLQLQPIGVANYHRPPAEPRPHRPPPRSRATLAALLARLARPQPEERQAAAHGLLAWPEPEARQAVLSAYLTGQIELEQAMRTPLATALADELSAWCRVADDDLELRARFLELAPRLGGPALLDQAPRLLAWWAHGPAKQRPRVLDALSFLTPTSLRPFVVEAERADVADYSGLYKSLQPVDTRPGPLLNAGERNTATDTLAALRRPVDPPPAPFASPDDLRERLFTGDPEQIRQALSDMSRKPGPDWPQLLADLTDHPSPRVRLHAHRLLRASGEREQYLRCTCRLLDDPNQDIQRMAIRALSHAGHVPVVATLVERLVRDRDPLYREVVAGLRRLGPLARDALVHARNRARPDRRARHDELLAVIDADTRLRDATG